MLTLDRLDCYITWLSEYKFSLLTPSPTWQIKSQDSSWTRKTKPANNKNPEHLFTTSSPGVPSVMRWKSGPLARSNDIPVLNGFVNTIHVDWDQNQSDLSDLTLGMHRVMGSPWFADCQCWTWLEVAIPVADQKDCGLWEWDSFI